MGDTAAVGVLLWGLLAEEGEGDGGDDDFDAMAPLALLPLCCGSTARGYRSQLCVGGDPSGASSPRGTTSLTSDWQRVVALPVRGSGGHSHRGTPGSGWWGGSTARGSCSQLCCWGRHGRCCRCLGKWTALAACSASNGSRESLIIFALINPFISRNIFLPVD